MNPERSSLLLSFFFACVFFFLFPSSVSPAHRYNKTRLWVFTVNSFQPRSLLLPCSLFSPSFRFSLLNEIASSTSDIKGQTRVSHYFSLVPLRRQPSISTRCKRLGKRRAEKEMARRFLFFACSLLLFSYVVWQCRDIWTRMRFEQYVPLLQKIVFYRRIIFLLFFSRFFSTRLREITARVVRTAPVSLILEQSAVMRRIRNWPSTRASITPDGFGLLLSFSLPNELKRNRYYNTYYTEHLGCYSAVER